MPPHDALFEPLPTSVELVLEENVSLQRDNDLPLRSGEASEKPSAELRVSFATERNQVVEIDSVVSQDIRERLWYRDSEYLLMMQDAGMTLPSSQKRSVTVSRQGRPAAVASPPLPCSKWVVRSLWIGSFVMGVLATSTFAGSESRRSR